jgi:hypothetical protein
MTYIACHFSINVKLLHEVNAHKRGNFHHSVYETFEHKCISTKVSTGAYTKSYVTNFSFISVKRN